MQLNKCVCVSERDMQIYFTKLHFGLFLYPSRPAGRPCAVLHPMMRINTEVRHTSHCRQSVANRPRFSTASALTVTLPSAAFDRVLESTSTREKMAKYQAAVLKQGGAQAVSTTVRVMSPNLPAVPACIMRVAALSARAAIKVAASGLFALFLFLSFFSCPERRGNVDPSLSLSFSLSLSSTRV